MVSCMLYMLKNLNVLKKNKIWMAVIPLALENPQAIWGCNYWQLRRMEWRISRSPSTAPQTHPHLQLSNPQENNTLEDNNKPLYNHLVFSMKYYSFSRIVWFKMSFVKTFFSIYNICHSQQHVIHSQNHLYTCTVQNTILLYKYSSSNEIIF